MLSLQTRNEFSFLSKEDRIAYLVARARLGRECGTKAGHKAAESTAEQIDVPRPKF